MSTKDDAKCASCEALKQVIAAQQQTIHALQAAAQQQPMPQKEERVRVVRQVVVQSQKPANFWDFWSPF